MIITPQEYARRLPDDILICEAWHSHERTHVDKGWVAASGYADRFSAAFGYHNPKIYEPGRSVKRYTVAWLPIPATQEGRNAFADVFNRFNITTTLNIYPADYFKWWAELAEAQRLLVMYHYNRKILSPDRITAQETLVDELKAQRPKACFVDLAVDIDSGSEQEVVHTLDDALIAARKITAFLSDKNIPHQVFFSGSKGFHIVVDHRCFGQTSAENNHLINMTMIELLEKEMGPMHFDPSLYSSRRQFRLVNTRHPKSGLYKIYISAADIDEDIRHIQRLAEHPQPVPFINVTFNDYLGAIFAQASHRVNHQKRYDTRPRIRGKIQAAKQSRPRKVKRRVDGKLIEQTVVTDIGKLHLPPCMREALMIGVKDRTKANRNQVTMMMAMFYKEIGRNLQETTDFLRLHALRVLSQYSSSSPEQIDSSTISAVKSILDGDQYAHYNCHFARKLGFSCDDTCEWHKHMRDTASSRRLYTVQKSDEASDRKIFDSVYVLRDDMDNRMLSHVDEMQQPGVKNIPLLVKVPPGVGKTMSVFKVIANRSDMRVLYVSTFHKLYKNVPPEERSRWLHIRGRHGDFYEDDGTFHPANCSQPKLAAALRRKRLNVTELLCQHCDDRDTCGYHRQFEDTSHNWFVMQVMFLRKVFEYLGQFDLNVFDEDILSNFVEKIPVGLGDVRNLTRLVQQVITDLADAESPISPEPYKAIVIFLKGLERLLASSRIKGPIIGDILIRSIEEQCRRVQELEGSTPALDLKELLVKIGKENFDLIPVLPLYYDEPDKLPLNFTKELLEVLHFEINVKPQGSNLSRLSLEGKQQEDGSWSSTLLVYYKVPAPSLNNPTIILDATGQKILNEALFECDIRVYDPDLRLKNPIEYVYTSTASITSLSNRHHRARVYGVMDVKLKEVPRSLVVGKKSLESEIRARLPPEAEFIHYFGHRGSNEYTDFDQVVLFGMPGLPPEEILLMAGALFYAEHLSTAQQDVTRRFPGTEKGIKVRTYVEPKLQAIAETFREMEMVQAAHRVRLIYYCYKKVVVISGIVLPGFPPTELHSINDVLGPTESVKKLQRRDLVRTVIELQLERLGFVCPAVTLRPLLMKGERPIPMLIDFFKEKGAWVEVEDKDRIMERSFYRLVKEILTIMPLKSGSITVDNHDQCRPLVVYGLQDGFIEKANELTH